LCQCARRRRARPAGRLRCLPALLAAIAVAALRRTVTSSLWQRVEPRQGGCLPVTPRMRDCPPPTDRETRSRRRQRRGRVPHRREERDRRRARGIGGARGGEDSARDRRLCDRTAHDARVAIKQREAGQQRRADCSYPCISASVRWCARRVPALSLPPEGSSACRAPRSHQPDHGRECRFCLQAIAHELTRKRRIRSGQSHLKAGRERTLRAGRKIVLGDHATADLRTSPSPSDVQTSATACTARRRARRLCGREQVQVHVRSDEPWTTNA
jgi:hypothetical protein